MKIRSNWHRRLAGTAVVVAATATFVTGAEARVPAPTTVGRGATAAPVVYVDSKGTTSVLWLANDSSGYSYAHYARRSASARRFTNVSLPGMPSTLDSPFIFSPALGQLEVIISVNGSFALEAWRSTDDGASWTKLPGSQSWGESGYYLPASTLFDAPGGPLDYAGTSAGPKEIVRLSADLTQVTPVVTDTSSLTVQDAGANAAGAVFMLGAAADTYTAPGVLPFAVGSHTGVVTFPCRATAGGVAPAGTSQAMAVGRSDAVVAFAGCGHTWTRSISASGVVGKLTALGSSPGENTDGFQQNGNAWVDVTANRTGSLTAAWTVPGDDIQTAQSSNGNSWKVNARLIPGIAAGQTYYSSHWSLSSGVGSWIGIDAAPKSGSTLTEVIRTSDTYRQPAFPSGRGISRARRTRLGSLAMVAPGLVAHRAFNRSGRTTVRLVDALGGTFLLSMSVTRQQSSQSTIDVCSGTVRVRLLPGRVKTMKAACSNGAIVIGGAVSGLPATAKGDTIDFSVGARAGTLTTYGRIG